MALGVNARVACLWVLALRQNDSLLRAYPASSPVTGGIDSSRPVTLNSIKDKMGG